MGRPDSVTFPGGSTQTYQYDALMRIERIQAPEMDYQYTSYDGVSNLLTKQTEHGNYVYDYDDVSRLTGADNPALADDAFTYDGVGNRETASGVSGTITHNANNELTLYGDISYEYDANGNMVRKSLGTAAILYTYDMANRLVKVEDEASGTVIAEYYYDPFGRRLWKDVGGTRTYFLYADEGLVAEYSESGTELRSYGYQPDSTWTTDPLWLKEDGAYYWYQNDHLGTPQKLVDSSGTVVWSAQYTAFGEAQVEIETITNNLRFPGQYFDAETGLHYNYRRYYNPRSGRYLRVDPLGFDGGDVNWYVYGWNDPVNQLDPWGESASGATLGWIIGDVMVPEPTDLLWPKWVGYVLALAGTAALDVIIPENTGYVEPLVPPLPAPTPGPLCDIPSAGYPSPTIPYAVPTAVPLPLPIPMAKTKPRPISKGTREERCEKAYSLCKRWAKYSAEWGSLLRLQRWQRCMDAYTECMRNPGTYVPFPNGSVVIPGP